MRTPIQPLTATLFTLAAAACVPSGHAIDEGSGGTSLGGKGGEVVTSGGSAGSASDATGGGAGDETSAGGADPGGSDSGGGVAGMAIASGGVAGGSDSGGGVAGGGRGGEAGGSGDSADAGAAGNGTPDAGGASAGGTGGVVTGGTGGVSAGGTAGTTVGGTGGTTECDTPLAAPTNVSASDSTSEIAVSITWTAVPCAERYSVYRAPTASGDFELIGTSLVAAFDDPDVEDTTVFHYAVRADSEIHGDSELSDSDAGSRRQGYVLTDSWGSQGSGDGQFSSAGAVSLDADGNVYVMDTYNHRVQKFSSSGTFLHKWGGITLGGDAGAFYYPDAIDVEGDYVYAGDDGGRIQKFSLAGEYVDEFSPAGFSQIVDLDVLPSGTLHVAGNSFTDLSVTIFDASYVSQGSWGSSGAGEGQFDQSIHIAVDVARSIVFVSDQGHDQLQYFSIGGTYAGTWGASGAGEGQFDWPGGLTLDDEGFLYVADYYNDRVQKLAFTATSFEVVAVIASPGATDVAVNGDQVVVLGDDEIHVYARR